MNYDYKTEKARLAKSAGQAITYFITGVILYFFKAQPSQFVIWLGIELVFYFGYYVFWLVVNDKEKK